MVITNFGGGRKWEVIKKAFLAYYPDPSIISFARPACDVGLGIDVERAYGVLQPDLVVYTASVRHPQPIKGMDVIKATEEFRSNVLGMLNVASIGTKKGVKQFMCLIPSDDESTESAGYLSSKAALEELFFAMEGEGYTAILLVEASDEDLINQVTEEIKNLETDHE